jgi:hypothetical protein
MLPVVQRGSKELQVSPLFSPTLSSLDPLLAHSTYTRHQLADHLHDDTERHGVLDVVGPDTSEHKSRSVRLSGVFHPDVRCQCVLLDLLCCFVSENVKRGENEFMVLFIVFLFFRSGALIIGHKCVATYNTATHDDTEATGGVSYGVLGGAPYDGWLQHYLWSFWPTKRNFQLLVTPPFPIATFYLTLPCCPLVLPYPPLAVPLPSPHPPCLPPEPSLFPHQIPILLPPSFLSY